MNDENEQKPLVSDVPSKSTSKLIGVLVMLVVLLSVITGFLAYQNMQLSKQIAGVQKVMVSPSPYASLILTTTPNSESNTIEISSELLTSLKEAGIANDIGNPEYEVFIFADLTEEGFSGKVLTENVPSLLDSYPNSVRVWYIHTVLPYRDNPNLRTAIATTYCLSQQNVFWNNVSELVKKKGQPTGNYSVENLLDFNKCIVNINIDSAYFDKVVKNGQELMTKTEINGIPSAIFIKSAKPNQGVIVAGATPTADYTGTIEKL